MLDFSVLLRSYKKASQDKREEINAQLKQALDGKQYTCCYVTYSGNHMLLSEFANLFCLNPHYVYACYETFGGDIDKYIYYSGRPYVEHMDRIYDKHEFGTRYNIPWCKVDPLENQNYGLYLDMITKFCRIFPCKFGTLGNMSIDPFTEDYATQRVVVAYNTKLKTRGDCFDKFLTELTPDTKTKIQRVVADYDAPLSKAKIGA